MNVPRKWCQANGIDPDAYEMARAFGKLWCSHCRSFHAPYRFAPLRSRSTGKQSVCKEAQRVRDPIYHPRSNKPVGRPPEDVRPNDTAQARRKVYYEIEIGKRPNANKLPCANCGHVYDGGFNRHEYHHHKGYSPEAITDVIPLCKSCHKKETKREQDEARIKNFGDSSGHPF